MLVGPGDSVTSAGGPCFPMIAITSSKFFPKLRAVCCE